MAMQIKPGTKFRSVDEYVSIFPASTKTILEQMRSIIKKAAPQAEEVISYNMPAYKLNGILVYFAGYDKHVGFYPTPSALEAFKKEISAYKSSKGAVQFPLNEPLPVSLITEMVKFRVMQIQEKKQVKK